MEQGEPVKISARNKLPGRVEQITRGAATANVSVSVSGMKMTAAITVDAVEELASRSAARSS
jgi:molybdopterin-binding protein